MKITIDKPEEQKVWDDVNGGISVTLAATCAGVPMDELPRVLDSISQIAAGAADRAVYMRRRRTNLIEEPEGLKLV